MSCGHDEEFLVYGQCIVCEISSTTLRAQLAAENERADELESVLNRNGFRKCDIAACNCGSWHAGPNLRAENAEAAIDALKADLAEARGLLEECIYLGFAAANEAPHWHDYSAFEKAQSFLARVKLEGGES
jgi:hypothetical protein